MELISDIILSHGLPNLFFHAAANIATIGIENMIVDAVTPDILFSVIDIARGKMYISSKIIDTIAASSKLKSFMIDP